ALLNIATFNDLLGHPVAGGSWEGFVIENILAVAPSNALPFYYRASTGDEIDLVLEFSGNEKWAVEIKCSSAPSLSKGFFRACDDIKADKRFVVYSGVDQFPMSEGVVAISLFDFMQALLNYK